MYQCLKINNLKMMMFIYSYVLRMKEGRESKGRKKKKESQRKRSFYMQHITCYAYMSA